MWGRLLIYDLTDNGLLDASVIYGLTTEITNALLIPYATPPFMALSPSGYLPRFCNESVISKANNGCSSDDVPCCGDPRCGENRIMQTIFTLIVREHNAYVSKLDMKGAGHGPHMFQLARAHIVEILASTCPRCRGPMPLCTTDVVTDILSLLSYSVPQVVSFGEGCTDSAGIVICDDSVTAEFETPLVKILPPNATFSPEALNFSYYLQVTNTPRILSLDPSVVAFFNDYYSTYQNSTSLLVFLLSERHGPAEEDIIGRLANALFLQCFGTGPVWINNAAVRATISDFYSSSCPSQCLLDQNLLAATQASSNSCDCNDNVEKGSLITFVVLLALLVVAVGVYVIYALWK